MKNKLNLAALISSFIGFVIVIIAICSLEYSTYVLKECLQLDHFAKTLLIGISLMLPRIMMEVN